MPPLYSSIALGATSATSTLMDKATQLITDIQSTLRRRNAVVRLTERLGHQLERTFLTQPTICYHCNQLILGLWGQQCKSCKLVSHKECSNLIESKCTSDLDHRTPAHQFKPKTFLTPTMCDHCGRLICGFSQQGKECSSCLKSIHHKCVDFVARECNQRNELQNDINRPPIYSHQSKISIKNFEIIRLLGTGSFSKVYLAKLPVTCEEFAIKVIKKTNLVVSSEPDCLMTEWKALNLGRNYRFLTIGHCCFQSQDRLFFVMEHVKGKDLVYHIRKEVKFTEDRARFHSAEIVLALMYLHSQRVIYRDLKLDNVILDKSGHCKLLDFGMSKILKENGQKTRTFCGTPSYISPEIIRGEEYDYSVDWWSLGVLMFEMLVGFSPFEAEYEDELYVAIKNQEVRFPSFLSYRAVSILDGLLTKNPQKRLGYDIMEGREEAIRRHPFFLFKTGPDSEAYQWQEIEAQNIKPPYIPTSVDPQVDCYLSEQDGVRFTPISSGQLEKIRQSDFEKFSFYSESFKDFNCSSIQEKETIRYG